MKIKYLPDREKWRLTYMLDGVQHRPSFDTKELAEAEWERVQLAQLTDRKVWTDGLSASERNEAMRIAVEIKKANLTPQKVWDDYRNFEERLQRAVNEKKAKVERTLKSAFTDFMLERERMRLSKRTLAALDSNIGRFVEPQEEKLVNQIQRQDVTDWLANYHDATYNSYRTSLGTFFRWCHRMGFCAENPVEHIVAIDRRRMESFDREPHVLTYAQCLTLFKATLETDKGLVRYVATSLLAGLRPEKEAAKLNPADINGQIYVRGRTAKTRSHRYVEIIPALQDWLKLDGDYPIRNLRRRFEAVRSAAKLIRIEVTKTRPKKKGKGEVAIGYKVHDTGWGQDCMRHTFASAFYAVYGSERTIAALGHGDYDMLFGHYRRLMTKEEAQRILSITPETCASPIPEK